MSAPPKYGLIVKKSSGGGGAKAGLVAHASLKRPALAAFGDDAVEDDEEEEQGQGQHKRPEKRTGIARTNELLMSKSSESVLTEEYDFDGEYDSFKAPSQAKASSLSSSQSSAAARTQYIGGMLATAKVREKEKERIFERKLLKERKAEDELYPDQPKFITSAYKESLKEKEKWDQEDRRTEELDKRHDVREQGMQGFYQNLLTKNIAVGGSIEDSAVSAYTAGSSRQQLILSATVSGPGSVPTPASAPALASAPTRQEAPQQAPAEEDEAVLAHDAAEKAHEREQQTAQERAAARYEKIAAARERYLARRNLASSGAFA